MKILIVCDIFPPAFGPRMGYLCKYLKAKGHHVDVVSEVLDDHRFENLASYPDHRVEVDFYGGSHTRIPRRLRWVSVLLRDVLFHYKDRCIVKAVLSHREMDGYDLILCSSYRTFPMRASFMLSRKYRCPLVVDLRDIIEQYPDFSYIANTLPSGIFGKMLARVFTMWLLKERNRVLRKADGLTTISPWHQQVLRQYNPQVELIYNGYDPELFFPETGQQDRFRICFTGRMISIRNRNPEWLFSAVSKLKKDNVISRDDFRLCWYVDKETAGYLKDAASRYQISEFMDIYGFIPSHLIPGVLNSSCILLQLAAPADGNGPKGVMTTKIFEALAVGKPLLLVRSDRSYLADIISRYQCGLAAESPEEIYGFLKRYYLEWKQSGCVQIPVHPQVEELFSRERQTEQFIGFFRRFTEQGSKKEK